MGRIQLFLQAVIASVILHGCGGSSTNEKLSSDYTEIGILATRTTHEITSSNWSVGGETMDRDYTIYSEWSPYLEELGIKKVRLQGGWTKCEKEKGIYDWGWLDEPIYDLPKKGITPWVCLCYGNPLYAGGETVLGSKIQIDPEAVDAWLKWVEAIVTRYKDVVNEWEVWNEPNGHNPEEVYADLLIKTSTLIKKIQPDSKLIGFATAGINLEWSEKALEYIAARGDLNQIDYFCYHPYQFNPDESYENVEKLKAIVKKYAPQMELFQGENGAPSEFRKTKALKNYEWTETSQAKWALRRMLGDLGHDIPSSIFSIIDLKYPDEMNRKGLLYANDDRSFGHKKLAYNAIRNMVSIFDDRLIRQMDFEYSIDTEEKSVAYLYDNKSEGSQVAVLWLNSKIPGDDGGKIFANVEISNSSYNDPVYVDLLTGKVMDIENEAWENKEGKVIFKNMPVYDSPIVIIERYLIKINSK